MKRKQVKTLLRYLILILVGFIMIYPLLFLITGTMKSNQEIFSSFTLIPKDPIDSFGNVLKQAWDTGTQYTMTTYFKNSFYYTILAMLGNIISCVPTAYAISRFEFKGKNVVYALVIVTLIIPASLFTIPLFILWSSIGFTDSYMPLIIPTFAATNSFFIFMLIQFFRTIPRAIDEAAIVDGCNSLQILIKVLVPVLKPSIITIGLLSFVWTMADLQGPLIYVSSASKFPVTLALKLLIDADMVIPYNLVFAMSLLTIIPSIIVFFSAQKYFVDGISTGSVK